MLYPDPEYAMAEDVLDQTVTKMQSYGFDVSQPAIFSVLPDTEKWDDRKKSRFEVHASAGYAPAHDHLLLFRPAFHPDAYPMVPEMSMAELIAHELDHQAQYDAVTPVTGEFQERSQQLFMNHYLYQDMAESLGADRTEERAYGITMPKESLYATMLAICPNEVQDYFEEIRDEESIKNPVEKLNDRLTDLAFHDWWDEHEDWLEPIIHRGERADLLDHPHQEAYSHIIGAAVAGSLGPEYVEMMAPKIRNQPEYPEPEKTITKMDELASSFLEAEQQHSRRTAIEDLRGSQAAWLDTMMD